jgi:hypothetical protein
MGRGTGRCGVSGHPRELMERYPDLLDSDERAQVDAHLRDCADCRALAARLDELRQAAGELGNAEFQTTPSADLDERALGRIRAEARAAHRGAPPRRWFAWSIAPLAAAAAALLLLLLHPASPLRGEDPGRDPGLDPSWHPKGDDDDDGPRADLQLAVVEGETTRPLAVGDRVAAGAEILVGGVVPSGVRVAVYREADGGRELVWSGVGDPATAAGGPLLSGDTPLVIRAPAGGALALEMVRIAEDGTDGDPIGRIDLMVEEIR